MLSIVVLISGGGSNLRALLEASEDAEFPARIVAIGADRDADGLELGVEFGVPAFSVPFSSFADRAAWGDELLAQIQQWQPDALSPNLINTHPAYLPEFPGAHAVRDALAAGAVRTGASIIVVDNGVDAGPILVQERVDVLTGDTEASLQNRIKIVERRLLIQAVLDIANGHMNLKENSNA